jgi:hypothetical protein
VASVAERAAAFDWAGAADRASARVDEREAALGGALLPGDEALLSQLLRLQAESAHLDLGDVSFTPLPREGPVVPVALALELRGPYYELPIFLDGLYRQRHLVEVQRITVEADGPMDAQVLCRVEARLARPAPVPEVDPLVERVGQGPAARGFVHAALRDAARLARYERFLERQPELVRASQANHHLVMRTLPRLIRQLAASPMDWAGASFQGGEARLTTEVP